ncbi:hypothetical protein ACJJTC_004123 [Scirpophaga incertulas]
MSRCDFKFVLLGAEHVGKTSLVIQFVNGTFNSKVPYQNTIGAAFNCKTMTSGGKVYTVGVWDTAGSERYEAMTKLYYRGAHAAIICYEPDCRQSWSRLRHWLLEVRSVEESCKLYLCGTKKDLLDSGDRVREVPEDVVATYSQGVNGHFLTSAVTGENVEELFQTVLDDCVKDKQVMKDLEDRRLALEKEMEVLKEKRGCHC